MKDEKRSIVETLHRSVSRRDFMAQSGAVALGAAGIGLLSVPSPQAIAAARARRGGRAKVCMDTSRPDEFLDPMRSNSRQAHVRQYVLYNPLVRISAERKPTPELATSWTSTADARQWVLKLRKGVTFHNGKTMTSTDVVYSLRRHTGPTTESQAKPYMASVAEVRAEDESTVRVILSAPNADFPLSLGLPPMMIVPDGFERADLEKGIGTGPFKLKEFKPGVRGVFVRNENYWKEGLPYVDEIELFAIPNISSRTNALLAGEIDIMGVVDPKTVSLLQKAADIDIVSAKSNAHTVISGMVDQGPTADANVRLALKYAADRQRAQQSIYKGYSQIGNDHPIAPGDAFYCNDIPARIYDPERARFYIRKAGLENQEIALYTAETPGPGAVEVALLFQQSAAAAGINIKVNRVPPETFWPNTWLKQSLIVSGWNSAHSPDSIFTDAFTKGARRNETHWANDRFQKLMSDARGILDFTKRKEMYCEMQRLLHEEGGFIAPCFYDLVDAKRNRVQGMEPHPMGNMSGYGVCEQMWLAS
jgi:peptide/nickel transport system substrate-binding protein